MVDLTFCGLGGALKVWISAAFTLSVPSVIFPEAVRKEERLGVFFFSFFIRAVFLLASPL